MAQFASSVEVGLIGCELGTGLAIGLVEIEDVLAIRVGVSEGLGVGGGDDGGV
jgi:hypothetical protein